MTGFFSEIIIDIRVLCNSHVYVLIILTLYELKLPSYKVTEKTIKNFFKHAGISGDLFSGDIDEDRV